LCYLEGVGTHPEERIGGGAFGVGLSRNILQAYQFLVDSYESGDSVHLFGFSRGAYTVRSLAGLIGNSGLLRRNAKASVGDAFALYRDRAKSSSPNSVRARVFRQMHSHEIDIQFIGVWDTVGTMGVPLLSYKLWQALGYSWEFHDVNLGPHIRHAFQALAIHEQRSKFRPAVWEKPTARTDQTLQQVWFSGAHADVGGGYRDSGLSDLSLAWMIDCASNPAYGGLRFRQRWRSDCGWQGDPRAERHSEFKGFFALLDRLSGRPLGSLRECGKSSEGCETGEQLHASVGQRYSPAVSGDFWPESFKKQLTGDT
jgi:uncharacterized protein (DUF2235 family)